MKKNVYISYSHLDILKNSVDRTVALHRSLADRWRDDPSRVERTCTHARAVLAGQGPRRGERVPPADLKEHRKDYLWKPANEGRGFEVHLGRETDAAVWERLLCGLFLRFAFKCARLYENAEGAGVILEAGRKTRVLSTARFEKASATAASIAEHTLDGEEDPAVRARFPELDQVCHSLGQRRARG